jgi:hypothetical protein
MNFVNPADIFIEVVPKTSERIPNTRKTQLMNDPPPFFRNKYHERIL